MAHCRGGNGLDIAIRALALVRRIMLQLRLDIQGFGDELPILKQLAVELGLSDYYSIYRLLSP